MYKQLKSLKSYRNFYEEQGSHRFNNQHITEDCSRLKFIKEHIEPTDNILELGCQTGGMTRYLAKYAKYVLAVDISSTYLQRAKQFVKADNVKFVQSFAEEVQDGLSFNIVIATELLEHVIEPDKICEVAYNSLKTDGNAFFSVPITHMDKLGEHVRQYDIKLLSSLLSRYFDLIEIRDIKTHLLARGYKN